MTKGPMSWGESSLDSVLKGISLNDNQIFLTLFVFWGQDTMSINKMAVVLSGSEEDVVLREL